MRWTRLLVSVGLFAACSSASDPESTGASSGAGGSLSPPAHEKPVCTRSEPPTGGLPSARADAAAALRADGRELVLFGGDEAIVVCGDVPKRAHVGDTWVLDTACGGWTPLAIPGPSPRARHVMVEDAKRDRALLFGGRFRESSKTGNYTLYGDVWAFDHAKHAWSELQTTGTPPLPRANAAAVVDGDTLWVFGGSTTAASLSFAPTNDLHALDLLTNEWREVKASGPLPDARLFHALAVDPASHRLYVAFGGDANAFLGPFFRDLHVLDLATTTWSELPATLPAGFDFGRIKLGLSLRVGDGSEPARLTAFGGHDDVNGSDALGNRNDVLTLDLPRSPAGGASAWQHPVAGDAFANPPSGQCNFPADFVTPDTSSIERRSAFAFAPLPSGEAFVVFGGDSDCGRLSDAWWYDAREDAWTPIVESLPGLTCPRTGNPDCKALCN